MEAAAWYLSASVICLVWTLLTAVHCLWVTSHGAPPEPEKMWNGHYALAEQAFLQLRAKHQRNIAKLEAAPRIHKAKLSKWAHSTFAAGCVALAAAAASFVFRNCEPWKGETHGAWLKGGLAIVLCVALYGTTYLFVWLSSRAKIPERPPTDESY